MVQLYQNGEYRENGSDNLSMYSGEAGVRRTVLEQDNQAQAIRM